MLLRGRFSLLVTSKSRLNQSTCSMYGEEGIYSIDDLQHLKCHKISSVVINKQIFSPHT